MQNFEKAVNDERKCLHEGFIKKSNLSEMTQDMTSQGFDTIIVGGGAAGCVLANRLSADPRNKVLLLEAGRADNPWTMLPVGSARLITNPAANWLYAAEPEANTKGRRIPVPRGKLLGGSSAINGLAFVRGQSQDFDTWAQMGNAGWAYEDVLPHFKRIESYRGEGDDRLRGRDGPLTVTNPEPKEPIFRALIEAAARKYGHVIAIGHPRPLTIEALESWVPGLIARGFALWPLSAVVALRNDIAVGV